MYEDLIDEKKKLQSETISLQSKIDDLKLQLKQQKGGGVTVCILYFLFFFYCIFFPS
jgi:hypothetical protein